MNNQTEKTEQTLTALTTRLETELDGTYDTYPNYSEPGYSLEGKQHIIAADWNNHDELYDLLEPHFALEWSDEWALCQECGNAVRTIQSFYGWTPYYHIFNDSELICGTCIKEDPSDYIEALLNKPQKASTILLPETLKDLGFALVNQDSYESGLHLHQTDDPKEILKKAQKNNPTRNYLFSIPSVSQFDIHFDLYSIRK